LSIDEASRLLGLRPRATSLEVKTAYREQVKIWHPDRHGTDPHSREKAEAKIQQINLAYKILRESFVDPRPPLEDRQWFWETSGGTNPYQAGLSENLIETGSVAPVAKPAPVKSAASPKKTRWREVGIGAITLLLLLTAFVAATKLRTRGQSLSVTPTALPHESKEKPMAAVPVATDSASRKENTSHVAAIEVPSAPPLVAASAPTPEKTALKTPVSRRSSVRKDKVCSTTKPSSAGGCTKKQPAEAPQIAALLAASGLNAADIRSVESTCSNAASQKNPKVHRDCVVRALRAKPHPIHLK
jgi:hypothetical protein